MNRPSPPPAVGARPFGRRADDGIAMATVALLGAFMVLLIAVIASRTLNEAGDVGGDRLWEAALQTAETGLDTAIAELNDDIDFSTGETIADLVTRDDIVAAADARAKKDLIATGEGEVVIIRPADDDSIFAVGFAPSREDPARQVRVIEAAYGAPSWKPGLAFLAGGNIKIEAKKGTKDVELGGLVGGMHVNGNVEISEKSEQNVSGCLTALSLTEKKPKPGNPPTTVDYVNEDCPPGTMVTPVEIPEIDPLVLHRYSQYDVCSDGARYGPAWPKGDGTALPGGSAAATPGVPCTGSPVLEVLGIKDEAKVLADPTKLVEFQDKKNSIEGPIDAVFFLWGRSAKLKIEKDQTSYITLITAKRNGRLDCPDPKSMSPELKKEQYGDVEIEIQENAHWYPHPDAAGYAIVAAGDIKAKIKGDVKKEKQGTIHGLLATHEQIQLESSDTTDDLESPKGGVLGAVIAEQACDTKDSKVTDGKSVLKKGDITYDGDIGFTDFAIEDPLYGDIELKYITER
jgi:hypothetical protein